jgi:hypothetical protein
VKFADFSRSAGKPPNQFRLHCSPRAEGTHSEFSVHERSVDVSRSENSETSCSGYRRGEVVCQHPPS